MRLCDAFDPTFPHSNKTRRQWKVKTLSTLYYTSLKHVQTYRLNNRMYFQIFIFIFFLTKQHH